MTIVDLLFLMGGWRFNQERPDIFTTTINPTIVVSQMNNWYLFALISDYCLSIVTATVPESADPKEGNPLFRTDVL